MAKKTQGGPDREDRTSVRVDKDTLAMLNEFIGDTCEAWARNPSLKPGWVGPRGLSAGGMIRLLVERARAHRERSRKTRSPHATGIDPRPAA